MLHKVASLIALLLLVRRNPELACRLATLNLSGWCTARPFDGEAVEARRALNDLFLERANFPLLESLDLTDVR